MKKMLSSIYLLLLNVCAFAQTTSLDDNSNEGKLYVQPGSVYVGPNQILINKDGLFFPVKSISVDEQGVYAIRYEDKFDVICGECGLEYNLFKQSTVCPHDEYVSK